MCGRFTLRTPNSILAEQFLTEVPDFSPRFNIAPTQDVPIIRAAKDGRTLSLARWGLIPSWAKDTKIAFGTINARGDTVAEKPAFRTAYKKRRCLVIADGYFEWKTVGKAKLPYFYEIDDGAPFAFAGLWEAWHGPDRKGEPLETCTIVTTEANELASEIHDRMPVILDRSDYDRWLNLLLENPADLIKQFPADRMRVRPTSTFVNNARHQGEECIAPREE
jgi:putative SOS response-associated peptidase YedK